MMKQNYLKSLFLMLMMCVCMGAWAEEVTFTFSDVASELTWENGVAQTNVTLDNFTFTVNGGGNNGKYYTSDFTWRFYSGGGLSITPADGYIITDVTSNPSQSFTVSNGTATTSFSATVKFKSITIKYTTTGGSTTDPTTTYNVTIASNITGGSIKANPASAVAGTKITLNATPNEGYEFGGWNVTGATVADASSTETTFTMPAANVNVSAKFNKQIVPFTTINEIFASASAAGSTAKEARVTFNNWVVSAVKNNNAYVTDNAGKGFIIYTNGHGFEVGDILSGTAACKVQLYNGSAELTNLTSTTEGLTVTKGGVITPVTNLSIADLSGINTGALVSYEGLEYNGTSFTTSDGATLKPYNTFITLPTLVNGKAYNVTGIYIQYLTTKEIAPRTAEDFELIEILNNYIVFFDTTENGTIVVKNGETVINDGDEVAEGTVLTIECTPASEDYRFKNWQYKAGDAAWATRTTDFTYTMPSANVQFRANFEEIPTYAITWSVNGTIVKTENVKEGAAVNAPEVEAINDKVFTGWVATETVAADATPSYVTPTSADKDATYYAVFATAEGEGGEACLTKLNGGSTLEENDNIVVVAQSGDNYYLMYQETVSSSYINYKSFDHEPILADVKDDEKMSWTLTASENDTWILGDATNGYLQNSTNNLYANTESSTPVSISWDNSKAKFTIKNGNRWIACRADLTGDNQYKFRGAGNQTDATTKSIAFFDIYKISNGSSSYSDFTTTVSEPQAEGGEITFVATDGTDYYATFSCKDHVVAFEDVMVGDDDESMASLKAYAVYVIDGALALTDLYDTHNDGTYTYIPKNTGVLLKYHIEEGTMPLAVPFKYADEWNEYLDDISSDNMLVPCTTTGIFKAEADGNMYYKLAYGDNTNKTKLGFWWGAENGSGNFKVKAGGAVLCVPQTSGVKGFSFDMAKDEDAIKGVEQKTFDTVIYDMQGRKVSKTQKGLYIINGRKMVK